MKVILSKSDTCINNKCIGICLFGTKYMQLDLECLSSEESGNKKKDAGIFYISMNCFVGNQYSKSLWAHKVVLKTFYT